LSVNKPVIIHEKPSWHMCILTKNFTRCEK